MKKLLLFIPLLSFVLFADEVNLEKAQDAANTFVTQDLNLINPSLDLVYERTIFISDLNEKTIYYVFNINETEGYIIISGEDAVTPILAYSLSSYYDSNNLSPSFNSWISQYVDVIVQVIQNNQQQNNELEVKWNLLSDGIGLSVFRSSMSVGPLLTTEWGQGSPYNNLCPGGSVTGCTATAMAQILNYWECTDSGTGYYSYTHDNWGFLEFDYENTIFDWDNMLDDVTNSSGPDAIDAVSTLMYACGVGASMNYSVGGSSAWFVYGGSPTYGVGAMVDHFGFFESGIAYRNYYNDTQWTALLNDELNALRPIAYTGYSLDGSSGHAFVCDGYDNFGLYHFNWGWGGSQDGYFTVTDLTPSFYNFGGNNRIRLGVRCDVDNIFGCTDVNGSNYNPSANFDDDSCEYECEFLLDSESIYLGIGISNNGCDLYYNMGYSINYLESIGYNCDCVTCAIDPCCDDPCCLVDCFPWTDEICEQTNGPGYIAVFDSDIDPCCSFCSLPNTCNDESACNYEEPESCYYADFGYDCDGNCIYLNPFTDECASDYDPLIITNIINDINSNEITIEWTGGVQIPTIQLSFFLTDIGTYLIEYNLENTGSYTWTIPCDILDDSEDSIIEYSVGISQFYLNSYPDAVCEYGSGITNDPQYWGENFQGPNNNGCNLCGQNEGCATTNFYSYSSYTLGETELVNSLVCDGNIGCTCSVALNYDPSAYLDDGSCIVMGGCSDPLANNYSGDDCINSTFISENCEYNNECILENITWSYDLTAINMTVQLSENIITLNGDNINDTGALFGGFFINDFGEYTCAGFMDFDGSDQYAIALWGEDTGEDNGFEYGDEIFWVLNLDGTNYLFNEVVMNTDSPFSDTFIGNGFGQILDANLTCDPVCDGNDLEVDGFVVNCACDCGPVGEIWIEVFGGTPPYTYQWSNGATAQNIVGLDPGEYCLTVTDQFLCENTTCYIVEDEGGIVVDLESSSFTELICFGDNNGTIDISVSGGSGLYTYEWIIDNGFVIANSQDLAGLSAGTYSLMIYDQNDCMEFLEIQIVEPAPIELILEIIEPSCEGASDVCVDLTVTGGVEPYVFVWSTGDTTQDLCGLTPGFYTTTVVDANGCEETTTFSFDYEGPIPDLNCGCTDSEACNYDLEATEDDGSCEYESCAACEDEASLCEINTNLNQFLVNVNSTLNPDNNFIMPLGYIDNYFQENFQIHTPSDTTVVIDLGAGPSSFLIQVNSVELSSIDGLPNGLAYNCNISDCSFDGGEYGCISISGTPSETGYFNLNFIFNVSGVLVLPDGTIISVQTDFSNDSSYYLQIQVCDDDEIIEGCTDPSYMEYNPDANTDDGSCLTLIIYGCTDSNACNYYSLSNLDDGSCWYADPYYDCDGNCISDSDFDGVCDELDNCPEDYFNDTLYPNGICDDEDILGCDNEYFCNYDPDVTWNDGSCSLEGCLSGCMIIYACNYCEECTISGPCDYDSCAGCTDETACNFDSSATINNGSCGYLGDVCIDPQTGAVGFLNENCGCDIYYVYGCTDPLASNFNPEANWDDGSCLYSDCDPEMVSVTLTMSDLSGVWSGGSVTVTVDGWTVFDQISLDNFQGQISACVPIGFINGTSCVQILVEEGLNPDDWYWAIYQTETVETIIGGDGYFGYFEEGCEPVEGCWLEGEFYEVGYQLFLNDCVYSECLEFADTSPGPSPEIYYDWSDPIVIDGCIGSGCIWEGETYQAGYQLFVDECNYYECYETIGPAGGDYTWSDLINNCNYCVDQQACNYGEEGDCIYPDFGYDCDGNCLYADIDNNGICDIFQEGCWENSEFYEYGYQLFIDECNYYECEICIDCEELCYTPSGYCYVWSDLEQIDDCDCIDWEIENYVWLQTDPEPTPVTCEYLVSMFDCSILNWQWLGELDATYQTPGVFLEMSLEETCCESCQEIYLIENSITKKLITTIDVLGREIINKGFQLKVYDDGSVEKLFLIK